MFAVNGPVFTWLLNMMYRVKIFRYVKTNIYKGIYLSAALGTYSGGVATMTFKNHTQKILFILKIP